MAKKRPVVRAVVLALTVLIVLLVAWNIVACWEVAQHAGPVIPPSIVWVSNG